MVTADEAKAVCVLGSNKCRATVTMLIYHTLHGGPANRYEV